METCDVPTTCRGTGVPDATARFLCILAAMVLLVLPSWAARADQTDPDARVLTIVADDLARLLERKDVWVLYDVREPVEFAVSHIAGAQSVEQGVAYPDFVAANAERVRGKTVVFYCSTSARSAEFALGVEDALLKSGAAAVYVLEGGVFAWHNQRRPLVDGKGATDFLHPFRTELQPMLTRQGMLRWSPRD